MSGGDLFPMHPGLLAAVARQMSVQAGFRPSTDIAALLAGHWWAHQAPWSRKEWKENWLTVAGFKKADLLTALGRPRCRDRKGDFSSADWRSLSRTFARLSERTLVVRWLEFRGHRRVEDEDDQPLLTLSGGKLSLWHAVPRSSRYFVLIPSAFFEVASALNDDASRLFCWLSYRHRGSKKAGTLSSVWEVELTRALAVDFGLDAASDNKAWSRLVGAAELLQSVGIVELATIANRQDRALVELSPTFFVQGEVIL